LITATLWVKVEGGNNKEGVETVRVGKQKGFAIEVAQGRRVKVTAIDTWKILLNGEGIRWEMRDETKRKP
jgi:hypothetical protein